MTALVLDEPSFINAQTALKLYVTRLNQGKQKRMTAIFLLLKNWIYHSNYFCIQSLANIAVSKTSWCGHN